MQHEFLFAAGDAQGGTIMLSLGILLTAALFGGLLGDFFRLPKVTSYLLVGILLGPVAKYFDVFLIPASDFEVLHTLTQLAMALVLFSLGCHFPLTHVRRIWRRAISLLAGDVCLTFTLVAVGLMFLGESWPAAILLGALAIATAPATTILVLKESRSEGPVTELAQALVAMNNLVAIVAFEVLFLGVHVIQSKLSVSIGHELGNLAWDLAVSVAFGIGGGLLISYTSGIASGAKRLVLLVAAVALVLGACELFHIPYLLTFLAMGMVVANTSNLANDMVVELDRFTGLLCVAFFAIHGAELDFRSLITAGSIGAGYIIFRCVGKYFGVHLMARFTGMEPDVRIWLGGTLLAQAGAAIALAEIARQRDPELGGHLYAIILGTVVVFELTGPLLIRFSLLRGGEIPLAHAIHHTSSTPLEELGALWTRIIASLGFDRGQRRSMADLTVQDLLRKNVKGISPMATFDDVIDYIEHSHDATFPVVTDSEALVGIIRYTDLRDALFEPHLGSLVRAADLASPAKRLLYPDDPAATAWQMFSGSADDSIPVITRDQPHRFIGVVRRRDLLRVIQGSQT